jgi:4-hydroxybenzoate polyprenyltransferase
MKDFSDSIGEGLAQRGWAYLQERFPPLENGLLVAVFGLSALYHSALLRGRADLPGIGPALVAFVLTLLFFFLLRVADEFKDYEKDRQYRPERPVPRGLVRLQELGVAGATAAAVQFGLAAWVDATLLLVLLGTWAYFGLMWIEFFVPDWLDRRPLPYMLSHMVIMPGIALLASAGDWAPAGVVPPGGLAWFLGASFFGGLVFEIGRKIRAPEEERTGVETYSKVWGRPRAVSAWLLVMVLGGGLAVRAAQQVGAGRVVAGLLAVALIAAAVAAGRFLQSSTPGRAKLFEIVSGGWRLLLYGGMGLVPVFL